MPLYEYACTKCDHHFDVRHSADEKPQLTCPKCQGSVKKVFTPNAIIFKGTGWYVTDHAKSGATPTESN
ncbi:MAG TPA: FmdB family zinc ribbon protein [Armatimonadota bacterium]|nr:FmdB family zinc ribbon protein [Armatimonadota bacterium]